MSVDEWKQFNPNHNNQIDQVYISDHNNELNLESGDFLPLVFSGITVTIERTKFEKAPFYINIMLVVDNESFWNLRGKDQVKFTKDLNVYAIQKKSMPYTSPVEFQSDIELNIEDFK